jgi:hypothetical protein
MKGGEGSEGTTTAIEGAAAEGLNAHIDLKKYSRTGDHEIESSACE